MGEEERGTNSQTEDAPVNNEKKDSEEDEGSRSAVNKKVCFDKALSYYYTILF